jgi:NDP-sugar pyrophosphorylase family protein
MIGVIVLAGPFPEMHGLDADRSPSLLPLGDRPALQHIVETLVTQGITSIELIVGYAPERVEHLLGNGDRWGCRFRYHLAADPDRLYRSLKVISGLSAEPWVLIHAERFPCVEFSATFEAAGANRPVLYYVTARQDHGGDFQPRVWGGTVIMPPTDVTDTIANYSYTELRTELEQGLSEGYAESIDTPGWIDVSNPMALLRSQADLLDRKLPGLLINGNERVTDIWISRNVTIHPSAQLIAPLYIGPNSRISRNCKIGPHVVIGSDCIIDGKTQIENSLIIEGSYVGEALEVRTSIVSHNLLVNARLNAAVDVAENFLIGRLDTQRRGERISRAVQAIVAILLFALLVPFTLIGLIVWTFRGKGMTAIRAICLPAEERAAYELNDYILPCFGADAWETPLPASWTAFTRQFLPGLVGVIRGQLHLVGLPPRTAAQVAALNEEWRELYLNGRPGLITEASIASTPSNNKDEMMLYLADAYYTVQRSLGHDLILFAKYFVRLIIPKRDS